MKSIIDDRGHLTVTRRQSRAGEWTGDTCRIMQDLGFVRLQKQHAGDRRKGRMADPASIKRLSQAWREDNIINMFGREWNYLGLRVINSV